VHERSAASQHVEERSCAEIVALLHDAKVFFARANGDLLDAHRLFGVADRAMLVMTFCCAPSRASLICACAFS
jgi:hypothetical protein